MGLTIPLVIILLAIIAIALLFLFPPRAKKINFPHPKKLILTSQAKGSICVGLLMILLWLTTPIHHIPESFTALIGVGLFAAFHLISKDDLKSIDWDILILMWGGLALGQGMQMSGLVTNMISHPFFATEGLGLIAIFAFLSIVLSTFMSNTAAANILLPITASFSYPDNLLLSVVIALSCSFAFALPISTPPNAMAYATRTFSLKEMIKAGSVISLISFFLILLAYFFAYRHIF